MLFLAACQPARRPIVKRPLEIEGKPKAEIKAPADMVRIGIRVEVKEVTVGSLGAMKVIDLATNKKERWPPGRYLFTSEDGKLRFDGRAVGTKWRFESEDADKFLECAGLGYRGALVVRSVEGDRVTVVNELSIDDYLKGVLPREVIVTWPDQALRVQAVASRTYLASHLGSHAKQGFDLCSEVHCQVYGGMAKEHPKTNDAVESTRDQILVYGGKPISAFFHSHCGGSTEQVQPVWGPANKPYLPRKKCGYCKANPRYTWSLSLRGEEILSALRAKTAVKGAKLKTLRVKKKSMSGRTQTITVVTDAGRYDLSGNEFRIALHPEKIRSTLWTEFKRHGDGYQFQGKGWGHGVGMCQWGAKGQAEAGRDYRDILDFYYPHSELRKWSR